ncbi:MAG: hypothetical protein ABI693_03395 [Bryobacteraceae bacterium]
MWLREILTSVLVLVLAVPANLFSQQATPASTPRQQAPTPNSRGLRILVLQGQDAVNSLPSRTAASPAVQVLDYLGEPVEGADVVFEVPAAGPSGFFENQKTSIATKTGARGQAVAQFMPNTLSGAFTIRVVAKLNDQTSEALIRQTNSTSLEAVRYGPDSRHWYKSWKFWAVVLAGAGTGAYLGYRSTTSSPANPTITLTPGPITIGGR